ncbi:UDP-N-acetylmuramoyl-tripeptide--D-alanyl-D-alanine ligase [Pelagibacterales bacterium SAG-MED13]|nr:UDP-N-acetylmuramoyl-tripeptide--D-alanyl-D-alanine ligase [Pelagibacterales bacterium SAG-MED13]
MIKFDLIGKVQIRNILMAALAAIKTNHNPKQVFKTLNEIKPVEGRFEKIGKLRNNSKVILDYAHTPEALQTLLLNIKEQFPRKKISLVFGCGGDRDKKKRSKMGKIANQLSDIIYLTDDNPRNENPKEIRNEIKKGIKKNKLNEIPDRKEAISKCIQNLSSGDIAIIAGKGHEKTQDYKGKKLFFSDRSEIIKCIKLKNNSLNKEIRLNIIKENSSNNISRKINFNKACINSKEIKKNDIFFAIKGKKNDGNNYVLDAERRKPSLLIVNKYNRKISISRQIKVKDTLKFLTKCARIYRENIKSNIVGITGSCGKTTLKEMLVNTLCKISKVSYSPKSYNNKYGLPLSLLNHKYNNDFGVFEVGMDKKGEIEHLTKILKPDVGVITNISYAHSKNFKNITKIAEAKSEIIDNINSNGTLILNADDSFYGYHKSKAIKRKLKVLSFSVKNRSASIRLHKVEKLKKKFLIYIKYNKFTLIFYSRSNSLNFIQNLISTLLVLSIFFDIKSLSKSIFYDFKIPEGRGDIIKIKVNKKIINLVDESYNSNPLSLKTALINYDKLNVKSTRKHLLLGDMLELGKHSVHQHQLFGSVLNNLKFNKIHVFGKYIKKAMERVNHNKKGKTLKSYTEIINLIKNDLSNNDYLLIKGSNATGLNMITQKLKNGILNVL